ncbi:aspartyl protease family protein [Marinoscillum sp. 108]|uniref:aspartyl protease family protein n=1 Tax=Marinoscillum sp. 108 TaxID=2653151 RepID=UPI0012F16A7F|nr:aspartyl protease family protein [Marinoscillum sp. 108]VXD10854.1 conserved exported hypothetical protein [Marinoscillum sp. 108]
MKRIFLLLTIFGSFGLSAQKLITSTPFELFGNHLFISLSVDDSEPVDFIFDTGDGLAVIDIDLAKKLNLKTDHQKSKTSAQGTISGALIAHNKVEIGDVKVNDIELYTTNLRHLERTIGRNIDGIIGYDLLKNYVVELNYDEMVMNLYQPDGFAYQGAGEAFKFKLVNYIPTIEASVTLNNGESYKDYFFINTGAGTSMDFNTFFATKHDVISKTGNHYSYPVAGLADQETMHYEGRVKKFSVGSFEFDEMPVGISQAKHGIQHNKKVAGILGNNLLQRFNITFNYSTSTAYFEANDLNKQPFLVNASGLNLQYGEDLQKLLVHRVFEGSPAEAAGIKENAEVISINGTDIGTYTLPEIRKMLKDIDNKTVTLEYRQEGVTSEASLNLEPLL